MPFINEVVDVSITQCSYYILVTFLLILTLYRNNMTQLNKLALAAPLVDSIGCTISMIYFCSFPNFITTPAVLTWLLIGTTQIINTCVLYIYGRTLINNRNIYLTWIVKILALISIIITAVNSGSGMAWFV